MKEKPILFSAPMVRAILDGRKTQTRRVVKHQPTSDASTGAIWIDINGKHQWAWVIGDDEDILPNEKQFICPYGQPGDQEWRTGPMPASGWYYVRGLLDPSIGGDERPVWVWAENFCWGFNEHDDPEAIQLDTTITPQNVQWRRPGDRLWVRESWLQRGRWQMPSWPEAEYDDAYWSGTKEIEYAADGAQKRDGWRMRPSIHMPRWASRITLEITAVRVEKLHSICRADAIAEGTPGGHGAIPGYIYNATPQEHFWDLWKSINGAESWEANPWVWAIEFKKLEGKQ